MTDMNWIQCQQILKKSGVKIEKGLSVQEVEEIEKKYNFTFPPDLKDFLSVGLPVSNSWINWRLYSSKQIYDILNWPLEGIKFDIKYNKFWIDSWGEKPKQLSKAYKIASKKIQSAPKLIPIAGHRYIPAVPSKKGNPIFSVYQTDIICYGSNLLEYIQNEYKYYFKKKFQISEPIRKITFWSDLRE